jgi:hypothetical protein
MTEQSDSPFGRLLVNSTPKLTALAWKVRALIFELSPDIIEWVDPRDQLAIYGYKAREETALYIRPSIGHVQLIVDHASQYDDPTGLLEGVGILDKKHINIQVERELENPALRELIRLALERNSP